MLMDFIQSINGIDAILLMVCIRAVFIGVKTGFIVEFFKSVGIIFSVFITFHYFSALTVLASSQLGFLELPTVAILVFFLIWSLTTLVMKLIREGVLLVFLIQAHPLVDRCGGALLGALRGLVVCGMVFYVFLLSYNPSIIKVARESVSRSAVAYLPAGIYAGIFNGLVVKFFPYEKINNEAISILSLMNDKKIQ